MKKLFYLLVFTAILVSCGRRSHIIVDDSGMTDIVLSNNNKLHIKDDVTISEIIPLESSESVMVGAISSVIVTDKIIIIYDSRQTNCVFVFNRDGKHRATINRRGRGPQEYMSLTHVAMLPDNKTIAILDNLGGKVLHFSLDGQFMASIPAKFRFTKMEYVDNENIVCAAYGAGESDPGLEDYGNRTDLLWFTDAQFGIKSSAMPERYKNKDLVITPIFNKFDDNVYVTRPYSDTIYQAVTDGLKAIWRIDMNNIGGEANPDSNITRNELDALQTKKSIFRGNFTDSDDYLSIAISMPPDGAIRSYLYSKNTGKIYVIEQEGVGKGDDIMPLFMDIPKTAVGNKFVSIVQPYHIILMGGEDVVKLHPELAGLTEDSNPVVILWSFKEGL